jgi:hypothetical protein
MFGGANSSFNSSIGASSSKRGPAEDAEEKHDFDFGDTLKGMSSFGKGETPDLDRLPPSNPLARRSTMVHTNTYYARTHALTHTHTHTHT